MKNSNFLDMDERNIQIAGRIIAVMYVVTIVALQMALIYRTLVLGQTIHDIEDMAIITTVNSLFLIAGLLYYGAVPIQRLKVWTILKGYLVFVLVGSAFTYTKYNIIQGANLTVSQLMDKFIIIASICGIIVAAWTLLAYLGNKKLENEIAEE